MEPRQCGKTTLAKALFPDLPYVTLEDPDVRGSALSDPRYFLAQYGDGAVFDEIQNAPELMSYGGEAGVSHTTAKSWLSVLEASGIVFRLPPYFRNFSKRLVSSSKVYFCDTGLVCWLMGIETASQLHLHPQYGAIFETAIVLELRKRSLNSGWLPQLYFWRDNGKLEIDLINEMVDGPHPIEITSGRTYRAEWARPMRRWLNTSECGAEKARIIYGGNLRQREQEIEIIPWFNA